MENFSYAKLSGDYRPTLHRVGVQLCNFVPRVLRVHCKEFFLMQCCLEPLGQHFIGFQPMQCFPKSIKAKLHRMFFMQCCLEPLGQYCIEY